MNGVNNSESIDLELRDTIGSVRTRHRHGPNGYVVTLRPTDVIKSSSSSSMVALS